MGARLRGALAVVLLVAACGEPAVPGGDAGAVDATSTPDAPSAIDSGGLVCASVDDCDDGLFCTGVEECDPTNAAADARGCVAGTDPCTADQECNELSNACEDPSCTDADGDGVGSVDCGGLDCDDTDPLRFYGNTEFCDGLDRDEDCNPTTFGGRDMDGDGAPDAECCNTADDGTPFCGTDCNDANATAHPSEAESCDGYDNDCDALVDEGVQLTFYRDIDGDGYGVTSMTRMGCTAALGYVLNPGDCNDSLPAIHPGQMDVCNAVDDDCDGETDTGCACTMGATQTCGPSDGMGGFLTTGACATGTQDCITGMWSTTCAGAVEPTTESCNAVDDDCDGATDEGVTNTYYRDVDGDGYGDVTMAVQACAASPGYVVVPGDCNDALPAVNPTGTESCNGRDDNCNGMVDETGSMVFYRDADGDGYGDPTMVVLGCSAPAGYVVAGGDCNDSSGAVHPGVADGCDGLDNDCNGTADPSCACSVGATQMCGTGDGMGGFLMVGACHPGTQTCTAGDWGACTGNVSPTTETCNGADDDCDGTTDEAPASVSCTVAHGTSACQAGACRPLTCDVGWGDCDGNPANGCETGLGTSLTHCGGCGNACGLGATACTTGECDPIVQVTSGDAHSCARRAGGQVLCWGSNASGQLGDGTMTSSSVPVLVMGLTNAVDITAGAAHTCARRSDDTVVCWGSNSSGQLGIGSMGGTRATPEQVVGVTSGFLTGVGGLTAGGDHTCARTASNVYCWGYNNSGSGGELGDGTSMSRSRPVQVRTSTGVLTGTFGALTAGRGHTCVRRGGSGGHEIWCWGSNFYGQLGYGGTADRNVATLADLPSGVTAWNVRALGAGDGHTCVLHGISSTASQVYCWGADDLGQLGDDATAAPSAVAVEVALSTSANQLTVGANHACARLTTGYLACWGANTAGQGGTCCANNFVPDELDSTTSRTPWFRDLELDVEAGLDSTCARRGTGQVQCWGDNAAGELGDGTMTASASPVIVTGLGRMTSVDAGGSVSCARRDSGELACWGRNVAGSGTDAAIPMGVAISSAAQVSVGGSHWCARLTSGSITCAGSSTYGQLGSGGITDAVDIGSGTSHSCAVRGTGVIACWGRNDQGQLGDGTSGTNRSSPVAVIGMTSAAQVVGGLGHSCARLRSGEVWCWGDDSLGQLGNDVGALDATSPVAVSGIATAIDVAAGDNHTCALLLGGEVRCWGAAGNGRLGNGTTAPNAPVPVTVSGTTTTLTDLVDLWGGGSHTCGRRASGAVWCWGYNASGQLGNASTTERTTPVQTMSITDAIGGDIGTSHSCALRASGAVACWGENFDSELGSGMGGTDSTTPVPVVLTP